MSSDNICVAVRVRPFNAREKKRKSKICIEMLPDLKQCIITPPEGHSKSKGPKKYTFDHVYWSFDGSKKEVIKEERLESAKKGKYECTNQEDDRHTNMDVYNDLGKKILENAWEGYNSTIFAYGQTGAGKSYSMVGYGKDLGIIPLISNELFERIIKQTKKDELQFKVTVSMIEIYNEQVQDLFSTSKRRKAGGLKVREHPKKGPYVEGINTFTVKSYNEIDELMEKGSQNRTVASTQMNKTSSRAHTLFTITLTITTVDQTRKKATDKVSKIVLVDLAGSERSDATGATGDRLKEGCAINQSLSALGNVISQLVKKGNANPRKAKGIFIPYRTSTLTWLLKESLGGNAKTIMVAALSPASINYDETLGTLQYANRAKQIKNKAIVNEDPNVRLIKGLKKELDELKKQLAMTNQKELEKLQEQLKEQQEMIERLKKEEEEEEKKKAAFRNDMNNNEGIMGGLGGINFSSKFPSIGNLHPDQLMNNRIIFTIKENIVTIGKNTQSSTTKIKLGGVSIKKLHAIFNFDKNNNKLFLSSSEECLDAQTYVNGNLLTGKIELKHWDRIIFGSNHYFRVDLPWSKKEMNESTILEMEDKYDYLFATEEFAQNQGLSSIVEDDKTELELQKKIKEEMEKINNKKLEEEKKLEKQRMELLKKEKEMELKFKGMGTGENNHLQTIEEMKKKKKLFEEQKLKQLKQFQKEKLKLLEKQKKLEEETKRQEEIQKKLREKELKDRKKRQLLERKLLELIPMVYEANEYSKVLNKNLKFDVKMINFVVEDEISGKPSYDSDIVIEVTNKLTEKENNNNNNNKNSSNTNDKKKKKKNNKKIWNFNKFESRFYQMQPLYENFTYEKENNKEYILNLKKEEDPFWDPEENNHILLGISMIYLKPLSHLIEMNLETPIFKENGKITGKLKCGYYICSENGTQIETEYMPDPKLLIGKSINFKVFIHSAKGLPLEFCTDSYVQFKLPLFSKEIFKASMIKTTGRRREGEGEEDKEREEGGEDDDDEIDNNQTTSPQFKFEKIFKIPYVTKEIVQHLELSAIKFDFYSKQTDKIIQVKDTATNKMLGALQSLSDFLDKRRRDTMKKTQQEKIKFFVSKLKNKSLTRRKLSLLKNADKEE